jgi:hypothetical protein
MRRRLLIVGSVFIVAAFAFGAFGVVALNIADGVAVWPEVGKAAFPLMTALLVTGLLGFALSEYGRARENTRAHWREIWHELREINHRVRMSRQLISAHRSAKTYGEQLQILLGVRAELDGFEKDVAINRVELLRDSINSMWQSLDGLGDEYMVHYTAASEKQREYEAARRTDPAIPNPAWEYLRSLPKLTDFLDDESFAEHFSRYFDEAKSLVDQELQASS